MIKNKASIMKLLESVQASYDECMEKELDTDQELEKQNVFTQQMTMLAKLLAAEENGAPLAASINELLPELKNWDVYAYWFKEMDGLVSKMKKVLDSIRSFIKAAEPAPAPSPTVAPVASEKPAPPPSQPSDAAASPAISGAPTPLRSMMGAGGLKIEIKPAKVVHTPLAGKPPSTAEPTAPVETREVSPGPTAGAASADTIEADEASEPEVGVKPPGLSPVKLKPISLKPVSVPPPSSTVESKIPSTEEASGLPAPEASPEEEPPAATPAPKPLQISPIQLKPVSLKPIALAGRAAPAAAGSEEESDSPPQVNGQEDAKSSSPLKVPKPISIDVPDFASINLEEEMGDFDFESPGFDDEAVPYEPAPIRMDFSADDDGAGDDKKDEGILIVGGDGGGSADEESTNGGVAPVPIKLDITRPVESDSQGPASDAGEEPLPGVLGSIEDAAMGLGKKGPDQPDDGQDADPFLSAIHSNMGAHVPEPDVSQESVFSLLGATTSEPDKSNSKKTGSKQKTNPRQETRAQHRGNQGSGGKGVPPGQSTPDQRPNPAPALFTPRSQPDESAVTAGQPPARQQEGFTSGRPGGDASQVKPIGSDIDIGAMPDTKDGLYQVLIALEGKRYSLERAKKDLRDQLEQGEIPETMYQEQLSGFKRELESIAAQIKEIRARVKN